VETRSERFIDVEIIEDKLKEYGFPKERTMEDTQPGHDFLAAFCYHCVSAADMLALSGGVSCGCKE
jgi:hypothetical protein